MKVEGETGLAFLGLSHQAHTSCLLLLSETVHIECFGVPLACEAESFYTQLNCNAAHCVYHSTQNSNKAAASLHIIQSASRYAHMAGAWPCRSLSPLVLIARLRHAQSGCIGIQSA